MIKKWSAVRVTKTTTDNEKKESQNTPVPNVLIVENDLEFVRFVFEILARKGIRGNLAKDIKTAADFLDKSDCNLVFISNTMNQKTGKSSDENNNFKLLSKIKTISPEVPVIMIAQTVKQKMQNQQQIVETAVSTIKTGFNDLIIKPVNRQKIEAILDTYIPNHSISTMDFAEHGNRSLYTIVGKSPKLLQIIELAKKIAPTAAPVLIGGECGTGKELFSYLIHHKSKRSAGPYIRVNCAALSDSLLESELFGHEKGAFTGAYMQRKGRFEMAHGGTLLLDEITETPVKFQAKLLRVIEQQDFERVGGNENVRVNVRIISTTNKDLLQEVADGRFRKDLYYRLSGVRLIIPPLRERVEDLNDLVWYFVNLYAHQIQRRITKLDPAMMEIFTKYNWPGNIRQLWNVVQTSLILGVGQTLSLADISWLFDELPPLPQENQNNNLNNIKNTNHAFAGVPLKQIERQAILDTLRHTSGNQTKAAKTLGISDRTLRDKIKQYREQGVLQLT